MTVRRGVVRLKSGDAGACFGTAREELPRVKRRWSPLKITPVVTADLLRPAAGESR